MHPAAPLSAVAKDRRLPGPTPIAIGLAILIAAAWGPAMPVTTGMALVALGATGSLVSQLQGSPRLRFAVAVHVGIYAGLYLLFVGAVAHSAMTGPQNGLSFLQGLDFGLSAGLMTLAARMSIAALSEGGDAPAR